MVKEDMISTIANETCYSRNIVTSVVESLLTNITYALSHGDKVVFSGFGTFEAKQRAARMGRNPHTNEACPIPERIMPVFTPGKKLKRYVCQQNNQSKRGGAK